MSFCMSEETELDVSESFTFSELPSDVYHDCHGSTSLDNIIDGGFTAWGSFVLLKDLFLVIKNCVRVYF